MSNAHKVREALQGATVTKVEHLVDTARGVDRLTLKLVGPGGETRGTVGIDGPLLNLYFVNAVR